MRRIEVSPGDRFGRLSVVAEVAEKGRRAFECVCECGGRKVVMLTHLRTGKIVSCGCVRAEVTAARSLKHGETVGHGKSPEYRVWAAMLERCDNPQNRAYADYGGRGIRVCERWRSFAAFLEDMGRKPSAKHSIERKNVNGNYEPENCVWATAIEQANNTRVVRRLTFKGRTATIREWSQELGISRVKICNRIDRGWSVERALTTP